METRRRNVFLYIFFVVLVVVFALGGYYFGSNQVRKETAQKASLQKSALPVVLSNKAVKSALANYTFSGKVLGVKNVPQGVELTTDIKGASVPKFIVTLKTKVYNVRNGVQTEASFSAISANQTIEIAIPYGLKTRVWSGISSVRLGVPVTISSVPAKSGN